jgi:hypothetical protein
MLLAALLTFAAAAPPPCGACPPTARAFVAAAAEEASALAVASPAGHPEPAYHYAGELMATVAPLVAERPGVAAPFLLGRSGEGRNIWGVRLRDPAAPVRGRMLVFANIHALEWVPSEVALAFLVDFVAQPVPGVEVVVVPTLNRDGRSRVEEDLLAGRRRYRRGNAAGVDLNRDFAHNRESGAVWKAVIPARYAVSPAPLSQPESRALAELAAAEPFDASVSLHAFGGFFYYPWAGRFARAPDVAELHRLGRVMQAAMARHPYRPRQLSRWGFFFRGLGMEVDHLYAEHGTFSFLVETTRTGLRGPADLSDPFRMYNPVDPRPHAAEGVRYLRALAVEVASGRVKARGPR